MPLGDITFPDMGLWALVNKDTRLPRLPPKEYFDDEALFERYVYPVGFSDFSTTDFRIFIYLTSWVYNCQTMCAPQTKRQAAIGSDPSLYEDSSR